VGRQIVSGELLPHLGHQAGGLSTCLGFWRVFMYFYDLSSSGGTGRPLVPMPRCSLRPLGFGLPWEKDWIVLCEGESRRCMK
jgi:hypothetical protein